MGFFRKHLINGPGGPNANVTWVYGAQVNQGTFPKLTSVAFNIREIGGKVQIITKLQATDDGDNWFDITGDVENIAAGKETTDPGKDITITEGPGSNYSIYLSDNIDDTMVHYAYRIAIAGGGQAQICVHGR
jgi:hypothetical protein